MAIPRFILIPVVLLLSSCATQRGLTEKDPVISIEATPCMGDCPAYRAEIYRNGMVIYEGKENVERIGRYTGRMSRKELNRIRHAFEEAGFFFMQDEYVEPWTDLPTVWIYYSDGNRQKRIKDYSGAPEALKELEEKVLEILDRIEWTKREKDGSAVEVSSKGSSCSVLGTRSWVKSDPPMSRLRASADEVGGQSE
jgi:hypothetical protein